MKCVYCGGRGWAWVGVGHNADREACGPCEGSGRTRFDLDGVVALVIITCSAIITGFFFYLIWRG